MLLCDTSGLFAFFDRRDPQHRRAAEAIDADPGPFVVSPYVLAELDYLVASRRGTDAERAALAELSAGAWELPCLEAADIRRAVEVLNAYADQDIGLADASIVVLSGRYKTDRVLTLDHRHFRVLRTPNGRPFTLVP